MEAFDQPWKEQSEGAVGAYWGVYDADREPKFEFREPIVRMPQWHVLAAASVIAAAILLLAVLSSTATRCATAAAASSPIVVYATATLVVWIVYDYLAAVPDRHQRAGRRGAARRHARA